MAIDAHDDRLFVGCRGPDPLLVVVDIHSANAVARLDIGRGVDTLIYDSATRLVYAACGLDANLVVYRQRSRDAYILAQAVTTRPNARTMALNPATNDVYLVTAEGVVDPSRSVNRAVARLYPNRYLPDSFEVLTYSMH
jgi:hypothetical protein